MDCLNPCPANVPVNGKSTSTTTEKNVAGQGQQQAQPQAVLCHFQPGLLLSHTGGEREQPMPKTELLLKRVQCFQFMCKFAACVYVYHVCDVHGGHRGHWISWNWCYRWWRAAILMLGTDLNESSQYP